MALTSLNTYISGKRTILGYSKYTSVTTTASNYFQIAHLVGTPIQMAGVGDIVSGIVQTSDMQGYIKMPTITNTGYLTGVNLESSVTQNILLFDRVYAVGAFPFNANTVLSAQPSYAARMPSGDYTGTQIWFHAFSAFTGNPTVTVTYTNQSGVAGRSTGAIALGLAPIIHYMRPLPLQAGDTGVQKIESVVCTVATVGTFNISVMRPLCTMACQVIGLPQKLDLLGTGAPIVYSDTALYPVCSPTSTSSGVISIQMEITDV